MAMGAALSVKPEFDSAQHLKGGGRGRVGSAGTPSQLQTLGIPGFSQPLAVGTIFPMAEPAFGDAASTPV